MHVTCDRQAASTHTIGDDIARPNIFLLPSGVHPRTTQSCAVGLVEMAGVSQPPPRPTRRSIQSSCMKSLTNVTVTCSGANVKLMSESWLDNLCDAPLATLQGSCLCHRSNAVPVATLASAACSDCAASLDHSSLALDRSWQVQLLSSGRCVVLHYSDAPCCLSRMLTENHPRVTA